MSDPFPYPKTAANRLSRRGFLAAAGAALPVLALSTPPDASPASGLQHKSGKQLPPWTPGSLDIHHVSTGRGNCAFAICPDGTTILIDAGAQLTTPATEKYIIAPRPNGSRRPGEWIARYIKRHTAPLGRTAIDYFVLTHLHPDHMGGVPDPPEQFPRSRHGNYQLTGVMDVYEQLPIHKILDRAYPAYDYPVALVDHNQRNYRAFLKVFAERGGRVERFLPGAAGQIVPVHGGASGTGPLTIQNLAADGVVWTGGGTQTRAVFPPLSSLAPADYPSENKCSLALRLSLGAFTYFSAGDMDHETAYGRLPWGDIEAEVARVAGPVDVAMANHHGYANACGPEWVRALRPRAAIISAWDSAHPTIPALGNLLSEQLYTGPRSVFATALKPENVIATRRLAEIASGNGHVIVRVPPTGDSFTVVVTDNADEDDQVIYTSQPMRCRASI